MFDSLVLYCDEQALFSFSLQYTYEYVCMCVCARARMPVFLTSSQFKNKSWFYYVLLAMPHTPTYIRPVGLSCLLTSVLLATMM
jgi:hypothetical protein